MSVNTPHSELVAFDNMVAGFDDMLVVAQEVERFDMPGNAQEQARYSDKVWRPMPFIPAVFNGFDQTANFGNMTQLSVPVTVGIHKVTPISIGPKDGRDQNAVSRYFRDAGLSLASQVNLSVFTTAINNASLVSKRTTAATGYDDLAAMGAILTEQGVPNFDRKAFYSARDYLTMAGNIAKPATSDSPLARTAYERAYVKTIGNFDLFENDQSSILAAATATGVTITNTNPLFYTPVASTADTDGNTTNIDNRRQIISIAVTGSTVKVGDAFTIAGVNSVHHISKQNTGQLKTFRITRSLPALAALAPSRSLRRSSRTAAALGQRPNTRTSTPRLPTAPRSRSSIPSRPTRTCSSSRARSNSFRARSRSIPTMAGTWSPRERPRSSGCRSPTFGRATSTISP
jgi:hypothetical protein